MGKRADGGVKKPTHERGGANQRAKRRRLDPVGHEEEATVRSILASNLVALVMWGDIPAALAQQIANWAVQDGLSHPEAILLAELGTSGRHPQNVYSQLLSRLLSPRISPALSSVAISIRAAFTATRRVMQKKILLPHKLFSLLYNHHREMFVSRLLGGSDNNISEFWDSQAHHPSYANHPMRKAHRLKGDYKKRALPIAFHGDGVATTAVGKSWSKSVEGYSWQSCLMMARGGLPLRTFSYVCISKVWQSATQQRWLNIGCGYVGHCIGHTKVCIPHIVQRGNYTQQAWRPR